MIKSLFFVIFLWRSFYCFSQNEKKIIPTKNTKYCYSLTIYLVNPKNSNIIIASTCGTSIKETIKHFENRYKDYDMTIYQASFNGKKIDLSTDSDINKFNNEHLSSRKKTESNEAKELKKLSSNQCPCFPV